MAHCIDVVPSTPYMFQVQDAGCVIRRNPAAMAIHDNSVLQRLEKESREYSTDVSLGTRPSRLSGCMFCVSATRLPADPESTDISSQTTSP